MRKIMMILLCCLLLAGCAAASSCPDEVSPPAETIACTEELILYLPDDTAEHFETSTVPVPAITEKAILAHLKYEDVLKDEVAILGFIQDGKALTIDFNAAFAQQVNSMGTAGEYMIMGSVVNTFLTAFDAEAVLITVDGQPWESGHAIYDEPLFFFK